MSVFYEDSHVRLYLGDCREVLASFPECFRVDHTITDPPYEGEAHTKGRRLLKGSTAQRRAQRTGYRAAPIEFRPMDEPTREYAGALVATMTHRWALTFCQVEAVHLWREAVEAGPHRYMRTGIWIKPDAQPQLTGDRPGTGYEAILITHGTEPPRWNGGGRPAVWRHGTASNRVDPLPHPTVKPLPLALALVSDFTDPGETILDPFAGSGTTGVAAKMLGRKAILIEREEKYAEVAAKRLAATHVQERLSFDAPEMKPQKAGLFG